MSVWIKRGISLAALLFILYLFWPLVKDLRKAAHLFASARWAWLPVVMLVQILSYAFLTWLNNLTLKPFNGRISFLKLMAILTSMAFIETAIPSAGASGVALRVRLLGKAGGYSAEAATFTLALESFFVLLAVVTFSSFGVFYLIRNGSLTMVQIVLLAMVGLAGILLVWGTWRMLQEKNRAYQIALRLAKLWNRLLGRVRKIDLLSLEARSAAFHAGVVQFRQSPKGMLFLTAYLRIALDIVTLAACFWMFGYPISIGVLLTGYGLILSTSGLASLPGGLGMTEMSIPVLFVRLGVEGAVALAAGLTYRLIAFWLVRFAGYISWQYLELKS